jgi:flagellar motor switch protein FliG
VNAISGSSSIYSVDLTQVAQQSSDVASLDPAPTHVSKMGDLMSQLQQLSQSDPAKFKQVMAEISDKLKAQAGDATGKADFLNKLADKFSQASQTGDMSALKPPQAQQGAGAAHHHHGHHAHAATYANTAQQTQPTDSLAQIIQSALKDVSAT